MGKKRITFSMILSIICVVLGLIYPVFALSYFGKMTELAIKGGEYDWMNFVALGLFVFCPIAALIVLPVRIISLVNIIVANSKMKKGVLAKGNINASGTLQFIEIVISFVGYSGVIFWIYVIIDKLLKTAIGPDYTKNYMMVFAVISIVLAIPYFIRAVAQMVSSVMLFSTLRKTKNTEQ